MATFRWKLREYIVEDSKVRIKVYCVTFTVKASMNKVVAGVDMFAEPETSLVYKKLIVSYATGVDHAYLYVA